MSFKKIHVLIRLAHRHSFNEQINHSDGYSGVIKGFKYDNLHPNGAAKALAVSKKGGLEWARLSPYHLPPPHNIFTPDTGMLATRHTSRVKGLGGRGNRCHHSSLAITLGVNQKCHPAEFWTADN